MLERWATENQRIPGLGKERGAKAAESGRAMEVAVTHHFSRDTCAGGLVLRNEKGLWRVAAALNIGAQKSLLQDQEGSFFFLNKEAKVVTYPLI